MAIKLPDGKVARTLPEQVKKNMEDITAIDSEINVIKESISTAYKIQGSATVADLNGETIEESMNGYVYNMTDAGSLNNADATTTSVQIGDNVVLVWNEGDYFWDRLSGLVDTSDLVTLSTDQTITGAKTFKNDNLYLQKADESKSYYIEWVTVSGSPGINFRSSSMAVGQYTIRLQDYSLFTYSVKPTASGGYDLGQNSLKYRDLYLSGKAYIGNLSIYTQSNGANVIEDTVNYNDIQLGIGLIPKVNNAKDLGASSNAWKDLYLSNVLHLGAYATAQPDSAGTINFKNTQTYLFTFDTVLRSRTLQPSATNAYDIGANVLKWKDLYLAGSLNDGTNSVTVAQISKTKLYQHKLTISNVAGFVYVVLGNNAALSGYVSTQLLNGVMIISAYGVASARTLYADTTLGLGYYSNGTFQVVAPANESITDDEVTEY